MKTFKDIADKFVLKFGICVMCVSLFSACATGTPSRTAMSIDDLEYFQTDCKIAQQQIAMLHSMSRTADDQLFSLDGWSGRSKKINWLINWHIQSLRDYC